MRSRRWFGAGHGGSAQRQTRFSIPYPILIPKCSYRLLEKRGPLALPAPPGPATRDVLERLEMPEGTGVSGLESDGRDRFFCGGGSTGKVRAVRRPKRA